MRPGQGDDDERKRCAKHEAKWLMGVALQIGDGAFGAGETWALHDDSSVFREAQSMSSAPKVILVAARSGEK
jgi:hypothetical protein